MRALVLGLLLALVVPASAGAATWQDWSWPEAPAYTFTVEAYGGVRIIPANVCPFGISDIAATRGRREFPAPRVDTLSFLKLRTEPTSHLVVNGYHERLRGWVWCG